MMTRIAKIINVRLIISSAILCIISGCSGSTTTKKNATDDTAKQKQVGVPGEFQAADLRSFYDQYQVEGMIVISDNSNGKTIMYNPALYNKPCSPASTFNILLALIGLEEGILKNEHSTLVRGDIKYTSTYPGDTMNLLEGFTNNRDWFFIRLSSLIGTQKILDWLHRINYGNGTVKGEENRFWINGDLAVTPSQQLEFIRKFYFEEFPFSPKHCQLVKKMMWQKEINGARIYGKRGSNKLDREKRYTGWFLGYIETDSKVFFFTNFIESPDLDHPKLVDAQKEIAFNIIDSLDLK